MCKKFLFGAILSIAVFLSACSKGETEAAEALSENVTTTTSETVPITEKTTVAKTETEITETARRKSDRITEEMAEAYFTEHGYRYESYGDLYIDMADFQNGEIPLDGLDEKYLKKANYIIVYNAGDYDLSFLSKCSPYTLTIEDYSGNTNLSFLGVRQIRLDNYKGGDLSSLSECEGLYRIIFENYSGNEDLSCIADLNNVASLCFENNSGNIDLSFLSGCKNIASLCLENYSGSVDFSVISDCPNIISLALTNKSVNAEAIAEVMKNSNIGGLSVTVEDYSSADAELLMRAAPSCSINYGLDSSPWDYTKEPTEGVAFFANLYVYPNAEEKQWECKTSPAQAYYPKTWGYHGSLVCTFTNFTEEKQKLNSVKIFRDDRGVLTEMPFADGSTSLEIDFAAEPNANSDFDITEEMFPFSKCETGLYKVAFDWNGERLEQQFAVCNSNGDFLTEEQKEIFQKAYEITNRYFGCSTYLPQEYVDNHTTEEFLANLYEGYTRDYAYSKSVGAYIDKDGKLKAISGDRGGDISVQDNFFMPIYSDENEVLFKNFVIHGHEDYPYYIWFEEINYHMVKTDEGWRFDQFDLWY